ncbi:hypothetical protein ACVFVO_14220 [Advenella kashmirensis]
MMDDDITFMMKIKTLIDEYSNLLDTRQGQEWLALFSSDGYYAVLRRIEHEDGNNVLIVGEDMKRLRGRISSAVERDLRNSVHMYSGVRANKEDMSCTASFALWTDGLPVYAGRYEIQLKDEMDQLLIKKCTVILDNKIIESPIYFPI